MNILELLGMFLVFAFLGGFFVYVAKGAWGEVVTEWKGWQAVCRRKLNGVWDELDVIEPQIFRVRLACRKAAGIMDALTLPENHGRVETLNGQAQLFALYTLLSERTPCLQVDVLHLEHMLSEGSWRKRILFWFADDNGTQRAGKSACRTAHATIAEVVKLAPRLSQALDMRVQKEL